MVKLGNLDLFTARIATGDVSPASLPLDLLDLMCTMSQPLVRACVRSWGPRKTLFIFNCRVICCHSRYPSRLSPPSSSLFSHGCQLFPIHTKYLTLTSSSGTAESDTNEYKTTRESTKLAMELCFTHDCLECLLLQHVLTLLSRLLLGVQFVNVGNSLYRFIRLFCN